MARVKGGLNAKKRHKRVLKLAKGYRGARSKQYRIAKQSVMRALTSAYAGRKQRKRQMRQIWIARIKGALNAKKRHNRVLKLAKGYRGARSKQYRVAKQSVMRALTSSYAGRKERKRQFRQLWIARINAAARMNGLSYSKFMFGLKSAGVEMNRKMLAEMAVNDAAGFAKLVEVAKSKLA